MKFTTYLISGAGNTFHIVYIDQNATDHIEFCQLLNQQKKDIAKKICEKNKADGFIFLKKQNEKYEWDFYNNDGSDAEMCGNATRCVGFYVKNILLSSEDMWFLDTIAGQIKIEMVEKEKFKIQMTPIQILKSQHGFFCDTGVPHLIVELTNFEEHKLMKNKAESLRNHIDFQPKGTNVTFVKLVEEKNDRSVSNTMGSKIGVNNHIGKVKAVSFERGVEDFTEACGTGAMAAAMYNLMKRGSQQTEVEMPGGTLIMDLSNLNEPCMTGPAILLGKFEYDSNKI